MRAGARAITRAASAPRRYAERLAIEALRQARAVVNVEIDKSMHGTHLRRLAARNKDIGANCGRIYRMAGFVRQAEPIGNRRRIAWAVDMSFVVVGRDDAVGRGLNGAGCARIAGSLASTSRATACLPGDCAAVNDLGIEKTACDATLVLPLRRG